MSAALPSYVGDCAWAVSGNAEPSDPPNELPTTSEPWLGRSDQTTAWRAQYHIGLTYLGGYITGNTPKANGFCPGMDTCDLLIARPPDFTKFLAPCSTSLKTASLGVQAIAASGIIDGADHVDGTRTVAYYAPETSYSYFSETLPTAPRYSSACSPSRRWQSGYRGLS